MSLDSPRRVSRKSLEVIVTSPEEALHAQEGGADRLEIVRSLDQNGLTPSLATVEQILAAVQIPVRVMLREIDSLSIVNQEQLDRLSATACQLAQLPIQGLVLGYLHNGSLDEHALAQLLTAAPGLPITFHRAFEHLQTPLSALSVLKRYPQVDRILVRVGHSPSAVDLAQAKTWQHFASPSLRLIVGVSLDRTLLPAICQEDDLQEVHVGRAARDPETVFGPVSRAKVAHLKSALS